MQQYLAALGMQDGRNRNIAVDGDFGPGTEQAVQRYERSLGIEPPTGQVDATLFAQLPADTLRVNPEFKRQTMQDLYGPLRNNPLDPGAPRSAERSAGQQAASTRSPRRPPDPT